MHRNYAVAPRCAPAGALCAVPQSRRTAWCALPPSACRSLLARGRDNPLNWPLVERFGVLSFPVGKIFHRGRLVGDFMGGTLSHEIVAEMIKVRDELRLAEKVVEADAAVSAAASADGGAKDEL